jgi:hypothetical protein
LAASLGLSLCPLPDDQRDQANVVNRIRKHHAAEQGVLAGKALGLALRLVLRRGPRRFKHKREKRASGHHVVPLRALEAA